MSARIGPVVPQQGGGTRQRSGGVPDRQNQRCRHDRAAKPSVHRTSSVGKSQLRLSER
jgi:hypothetical protein